jgi:membrane complex biogenesis BtpA family protein
VDKLNNHNRLSALFKKEKVLIGVVHLKPLPGSPSYKGESLDEIFDLALKDTECYALGKFHGVIIENHGDIPFNKPEDIGPETVAVMSVITNKLRVKYNHLIFGINVLANAAIPALSVAMASNSAFIRVNQYTNAYIANEGFVEGLAAKITRYRRLIYADSICIFADVHVKHGSHAIVADRPIEELAKDSEFFGADVLIATGSRTADSAEIEEVNTIKLSTNLPVLIGSGITKDNVNNYYHTCDGFIIASSLKYDGLWNNSVDIKRVNAFTKTLNSLK